MVETAKFSPDPDGQDSDTGAQSALVNTRVERMNSQERADYLEEKFTRQQNFYYAAKLEGAHLPIKYDHPKIIDRQNSILEEAFELGENIENIATHYEKDRIWVRKQIRLGLFRLRHRSSYQLQERFPEEAIITTRSDAHKQKAQGRENDLVEQLQRTDISSKEVVKKLMASVGDRFYRKHKDLFINLRDLIKEQNFHAEDDYSSRVVQMTSDMLAEEGIVIREINPEKSRSGNPIHIIWFQDRDDVIDLFNQHIRVAVEASIS